MKIHRATLLFCAALVSVVGCLPSNIINPTVTPVPSINHAVNNLIGIRPLWVIENAYIHRNDQDSALDASAGKTCFLGNLDEKHEYPDNLVCLESRSSKILWNNYSGIHDEIEVTPDGIFVTYIGPASVKKYDFQNGNPTWKNKQLGGRMGSSYLYFQDGQIVVIFLHEKTTILNVEGEVTRTIDDGSVFVSQYDEILIDFDGLYSSRGNSDVISWNYEDTKIYYAPIFTNEKIIVRRRFSKTIYALNRTSGGLLWEREIPNVIGNLVHSPEKQLIYVLCEDGTLLAIDENSGEESVIAAFSPSPFLLSDGDGNPAYQLAHDDEENILLVYLGDSRQLFAFQEE